MTVFAYSQTTNKLVNEAANDSAGVSGQDRKIPPALGTNQVAGFGGFRPLSSLEKKTVGAGSEVWIRVCLIAPVKKFGRVRLRTNFPSKQICRRMQTWKCHETYLSDL